MPSLKDRFWAFHITHLSKPAEYRPIFHEIVKGQVQRILQLGLGDVDLSTRVIRAAARFRPVAELRFTGIDLFEARQDPKTGSLDLKTAYRTLAGTGARIRLVPGDPLSAIAQVANSLADTDLIVVSRGHPPAIDDHLWYFFPRMMHQGTAVFVQKPCSPEQSAIYDRVAPSEIRILADRNRPARAA